MIDLGNKPEEATIASPSKDKDPKKYYPTLHINCDEDADIPEDMIGKDMKVTAIVRITGYSKSKSNNYSHNSIDMEVRKMDFGKNKKYDTIFEAVMDSDSKEDND